MSILKSLGVIVGIAFLMILKEAAGPYLVNTGHDTVDWIRRNFNSYMNSNKSSTERKVLIYQPIVEQGKFRLVPHAMPGRSSKTLVLPEKFNTLKETLRRVLNAPSNNGIPNRYGVLLQGPPGTGKTQYVIALATELNIPMVCLTLSSVFLGDESVRARVFSSFPSPCLIFIDDADAIFETKVVRDGKLAIDILLSGIDGPYVPHNIIYVMSCNSVEKLPKKLLRRFQHKLEFELPTAASAASLFKAYFPLVTPGNIANFTTVFQNTNADPHKENKPFISFSDLEGCFKQSFDHNSYTDNVSKLLPYGDN